jgi:hypothetical protein
VPRYKRRDSGGYSPMESFKGTYDFVMSFIDSDCEEHKIGIRAESVSLRSLVELGWPDRLVAAFQGGVVKLSLFKPETEGAFWHTYLPAQAYMDIAQTLKGLGYDITRMGGYLP